MRSLSLIGPWDEFLQHDALNLKWIDSRRHRTVVLVDPLWNSTTGYSFSSEEFWTGLRGMVYHVKELRILVRLPRSWREVLCRAHQIGRLKELRFRTLATSESKRRSSCLARVCRATDGCWFWGYGRVLVVQNEEAREFSDVSFLFFVHTLAASVAEVLRTTLSRLAACGAKTFVIAFLEECTPCLHDKNKSWTFSVSGIEATSGMVQMLLFFFIFLVSFVGWLGDSRKHVCKNSLSVSWRAFFRWWHPTPLLQMKTWGWDNIAFLGPFQKILQLWIVPNAPKTKHRDST